MPDGRLVELVDRLPRSSYAGRVYRHQGPGHPPLNAEGARIHGGRWNPKESFPVLYLAPEEKTVIAEFYRLAERQGMEPASLLPRRLYRYNVRLGAVLDLTDDLAREAVRLDSSDLAADDPSKCQAVGDAAHYAGFEAVRAASAAGPGTVLAVFMDQLKPESFVEPIDFIEWDMLPGESG
jgi:RES domain-containing protein